MSQSWTFPSSSGSGTYTTKLASDGKLLCDCRGWTMRRNGKPRECKHCREVATRLGQPIVPRGEFVYVDGAASAPPPVAAVRATPAAATPAPMLASAMTSPVTGAKFDAQFAHGWVLEEKLDGHRVTVRVEAGGVSAWSRPRAGEAAKSRELRPALVEALRVLSPGVYDGELVAPGGHAWNVVERGAHTVFAVFDILEHSGLSLVNEPYEGRRAVLLDELRRLPAKQTAITTVESLPPSWATVAAIWKRGGEGAILKRVGSAYRPGARSADWIKVKASHSAVLTLIGFEPGKNGPYSAMTLHEDATGTLTTVKTLGNALLRQITSAPRSFIGKRVVITYQQRTPSGTFRHGIFDHFAGDGE